MILPSLHVYFVPDIPRSDEPEPFRCHAVWRRGICKDLQHPLHGAAGRTPKCTVPLAGIFTPTPIWSLQWLLLPCCSHLGLAGPKLILTDFKHVLEGKPASPTPILPVGDRGPALKALTVDTLPLLYDNYTARQSKYRETVKNGSQKLERIAWWLIWCSSDGNYRG